MSTKRKTKIMLATTIGCFVAKHLFQTGVATYYEVQTVKITFMAENGAQTTKIWALN